MKPRSKNLKIGDKVEWNSPQGRVVGTVKRKLTSRARVKTHQVAASKEKPEFLVKSLKSGKEAAHKPKALKKVR